MMAYTPKNLTGALFRNKRKSTEASLGSGKPDYTGNVLIDGVKYELAGWVKTSRDGGKYLSLTVKPPHGPRSAAPEASETAPGTTAPPSQGNDVAF